MTGRLALVGIGPGDLRHLTRAAEAELRAAEMVIGYTRYLELLPTTLAPGDREGFPIGEERARARRAVDLAVVGRRVALVSSGDAGIYGMAPLAIDELAARAEARPELVVIPGVTAAVAAAALLGAPLGVDFACLSLSDLLLPRVEVLARVSALAALDIVLVIYNPASRSRTKVWHQAVEAVQRRRSGEIPAAAVRRGFREGQAVEVSTIAELHRLTVDMETTVVVGCSRTRRYSDLLYTVRDGHTARDGGPG